MPIRELTPEEQAAKIANSKTMYELVTKEGKTPEQARVIIDAARAAEEANNKKDS